MTLTWQPLAVLLQRNVALLTASAPSWKNNVVPLPPPIVSVPGPLTLNWPWLVIRGPPAVGTGSPISALPLTVNVNDGDRMTVDIVLTQNAAIMGYIADTYPQAHLAGDGSPQQRAQAAKWLAFVNSDLHPAFHPLFGPARFIGDEAQFEAVKDAARRRLRGMYETAEKQLEGRDWLAGFRSFADPYFYITLRWADRTGVDLSGLPNIAAFKQRMEADAGVQAALKAEGLA